MQRGSDGAGQAHGPDATGATGAAAIRLEGVAKRYPDGTVAVASLDLDVRRGELLALVGPSGCGKSTTLRMVNRLVEPSAGRIWLEDEDVTTVDAVRLRRRIGYVIQQVGLFPHRTVTQNVATVPGLLGWDRARTSARVDEVLELVGLDPGTHGGRYPHELSGGQQQRVGVARALAADPPVLLMDEPFGAVDPVARERLQTEFRRIQAELGTTVLFVTHDLDEAVRIADRIAVFSQGGRLEQVAEPATVLGAPASDFVAAFVGSDRGLRRLAVTPIEAVDLDQPPRLQPGDRVGVARAVLSGMGERYAVVVDEHGRLLGWLAARHLDGDDEALVADRARPVDASIALGEPLRRGLAEIVQQDAGWLPVLDGGRYVGVLTPGTVHAALRRTAPAPQQAVLP